eukprot:CAMPEP_0185725478 /NCGR_PEP_ID=MMETSP1171-20130828/1730_1 /TAXON_ID=374046 /ORGANISM="Helicotheca tamensis, Strain CCMP826" /LENGTH=689 /DNA_ID=CAMNT_0028393621 /DNA_START=70 /DNA_END=2139 /DNA_ORIENTATION=+
MGSITDDEHRKVTFADSVTNQQQEDTSYVDEPGPEDVASIRQKVTFQGRKFDVGTLPACQYRVYKKLEIAHGETYALTTVFMIRTGIELHRAWHNTLLTAKILQQIKDQFKIRMTWEFGVIKLKFHVEDGLYELQYKVPYDYDSEFQDLYMKIAVSYLDGRMTIHQALLYQSETKAGEHTAKSGLFIRDFPGRLVVYPLLAATCAVIFFGGDWYDFAVTALTGFASGLVEYLLVKIGGSAKLLIDVLVGVSTGFIAALFYRYNEENTCMPAIFLGTLYWFFYGTAFVVGILEIISGELETGVVRFMAVSVKTFVLSIGTALGMMIVLNNPKDAYLDIDDNCGNIDLDKQWWRIPLYLLCSASALGQYRFPIVNYYRALSVQLVGYEVQYQIQKALAKNHPQDFLDNACANIFGAMAAVVFAYIMSYIVESTTYYYHARVLQRHEGEFSRFGEFMYSIKAKYIRITNWFRFGKKNDLVFLEMSKKLQKQREELENPSHSRGEIALTEEEEMVLLEAVIEAEDLNIWALLMPTLYQLVPGSLIARMFFDILFPPPLDHEFQAIDGTEYTFIKPNQPETTMVMESLLVTAVSLALGILVGFVVVEYGTIMLKKTFRLESEVELSTDTITDSVRKKWKSSRNFYTHTINQNNPDSDSESESERHSNYNPKNEEEGFDENVSESNKIQQENSAL